MRVADDDAALGVAGALGEALRRAGLDQLAAHPALEADARALDVGAGRAEDLDRLGEVDDLDPDFLEERVGVVLDGLEALGGDDLDRWQLAGQIGQVLHRPGQARGLAGRSAAARGRVVGCLGGRHRVTLHRGRTAGGAAWRQSRRASSRPSKKARLARRGRRIADLVERDAAARSIRRERCLGHGCLGDDQRVGGQELDAPVSVDRRVAPSLVPASDDGVGRIEPPAAVNRGPQRHVGGAVEQAATDDRGRR